MTIAPLTPVRIEKRDAPERIAEAAGQFESLLISEMLREAREARAEDGDQTTASIQEMAEQQMASAMANGGGLGLAKLILTGLHQSAGKADSTAEPSSPVR